MPADSSLRRLLIANLKPALATAALSTGSLAQAADAAEALAAADALAAGEAIVVTGYRVSGLSDLRTPLPLSDTPLTATVIADDLLSEQGRRTLRDALRNVTGISFQAGEGNPPGGGDSFSVRGFSARDDIFVDGVRDPGNYFRDPFNAERIEVTKGPASAFAGRGNIGGTVNIVSRQPILENRFSGEFGGGTDAFARVNADASLVLSEAAGAAVRLNLLGHRENVPGRDHARNRRWGVAPSVALGLGKDTSFVLSWFHMEQDDLPDMGLPNARNRSLVGSGFEGRVAPVDRRNFYGYSTDFRTVRTDIATGRFEHRFSDAVGLRNTLRYADVSYRQEASSPRFVGNVTTLGPETQAVGNRKPRDQRDTLFTNQTQLALDLGPERLRHNLVVGLEFTEEVTTNRRRLDADGPRLNLFNPVLLPAPPIPFNGTRARIDLDTVSAYLFDTISIGEAWRILAGVRHDRVKSRVRGFDDNGIAPQFVTDLAATDREWSGNVGLVWKPAPNASLYAAWGTSFEPSARAEIVQIAGGNNNPPVTPGAFFVDPERARAVELGAKVNLLGDQLELSAALFELTRTNARTPGLDPQDPPIVLEGRQRARGIEFQAVGKITPAWDIFLGYAYLDGKVTRSNLPAQVGLRLDNAPRHSLALWTGYAVTDRLTIGGGVQHQGERLSNIPDNPAVGNLVIAVPAFTVVDAFAEYRLGERAALRVNVYNLGNTLYFQSFNNAQSIPSPARSAVFTLALDL
ncbi:MAG: TonB-dependent siderophore receptor [Sphingomonadaceae bacterium]